ncbi:hypothetical protein MMC10_000775 [Thelotrema lepadinum]|nr:hypothetical protein [Thelotrema lepadinum]
MYSRTLFAASVIAFAVLIGSAASYNYNSDDLYNREIDIDGYLYERSPVDVEQDLNALNIHHKWLTRGLHPISARDAFPELQKPGPPLKYLSFSLPAGAQDKQKISASKPPPIGPGQSKPPDISAVTVGAPKIEWQRQRPKKGAEKAEQAISKASEADDQGKARAKRWAHALITCYWHTSRSDAKNHLLVWVKYVNGEGEPVHVYEDGKVARLPMDCMGSEALGQ